MGSSPVAWTKLDNDELNKMDELLSKMVIDNDEPTKTTVELTTSILMAAEQVNMRGATPRDHVQKFQSNQAKAKEELQVLKK